ncbi:MAG: hypothetical protein Q9167_003410 [Letrouitia subvulpina]
MIWEAINDGTIFSCPSLLASFVFICYADLKKYRFTYLFGFPALHSDPTWKVTASTNDNQLATSTFLSGAESTALVDSVQTWRYRVDTRQHGFFLAKKQRNSLVDTTGDHTKDQEYQDQLSPGTPSTDIGFTWVIESLEGYENGFFDNANPEDNYVCFADPSNYNENPGWMLRNLLILVKRRWKLSNVQILCYREIQARREDARSLILVLETPDESPDLASKEKDSVLSKMPKVSGWERSSSDRLRSKVANLGEFMDPQRLADQAVDLNLKLIKWRIAPGLDLEKVKQTKCLLLGAGTLGSYVARNLLGWGVRKVTFVDNGHVSFSNPVRQPLFNFNDCLSGGAKKAHRASEALKEIYPGVISEGHVMSVPMCGHPIQDEDAVKADYEKLENLIAEHDAIFLLMDTRESRWLPTVMGKAAGKIVMNAALGFDSFVVMRHGVMKDTSTAAELGCYFCNDVVAPADSLADRTLDQQCTVTRPGVAAIASALLVELLVSILQHPLGALAPAPASPTADRGDHPLGTVPYQIRGFLSTFQNLVIRGSSYECCSACSSNIVRAYTEDGWQFVKKALNEKGYVEEISGLAEVQRAAEKAINDMDLSDDSSARGDEEDEGDGEII